MRRPLTRPPTGGGRIQRNDRPDSVKCASRYADTLWDDFKEDSPDDIKLGVVLKVAEDYRYNREILKNKANGLNLALFLTALEAMFVAGAVLSSRLVT